MQTLETSPTLTQPSNVPSDATPLMQRTSQKGRRTLPPIHTPTRKASWTKTVPARVPYIQQANTTQRSKARPWHYRHPLLFGLGLLIGLLLLGFGGWLGWTTWVTPEGSSLSPALFHEETFMPKGRFTPDQQLQLHTVFSLLQSVVSDPEKLTPEVTRTLFHRAIHTELSDPKTWHHMLRCAGVAIGTDKPLYLGSQKVLFYQPTSNNQDILLETFLEGSQGTLPVHVVLRSEVVGYQVLGFFLRDNTPALTTCLQSG
ncbi:MAG: hypothetical protein ACKO37_04010 [Vampirovibrionales bacterium]